jgi:hypothetical protein
MHFFKLEKARSLLRLGNVIMKLCRRSSRTLGILEDVQTVVVTLSNQLERLLKILVRLAGKTDDDVARQRESPARVLDTLDSC